MLGWAKESTRTSSLIHATSQVPVDVLPITHELLTTPLDAVSTNIGGQVATVLRFEEQERVTKSISIPARLLADK